MDFWKAGESFVRSAGSAAGELLEIIASAVAGEADTLRDGTEHDPVRLPQDLAAHPDAQTEWWYYTGHAKTDSDRRFGLELVFFKRRTDLDKFSIVPLRLIGNPFYFAHFAITDIDSQTFRYDHRKSANGPLEIPAIADTKTYYLKMGDWSASESNGVHVLRANIGTELQFDATLRPQKLVVLNGKNGVSFKDHGEASRYFSYTRMALEGDLLIDGKVEHFSGSAWMDREFGTWEPTENQKGWDWFSIQLDNNTELMCYQLRNGKGEPSTFSSGTFVDPEGNPTTLNSDQFTITPRSYWKSPGSGAEYPISWNVKVPPLEIDLDIEPLLKDQELDTRGTTMIVYWEGACTVSGSSNGSPVTGDAYVEMVGYDRSHDDPNLASFLIGSPVDLISRFSK
jgi:predicted secreted hydrolase